MFFDGTFKVGQRLLLSGVDNAIEDRPTGYEWQPNEQVTVMYLVLDGVTYEATENPDDGYRSYMEDFRVSDHAVANTFVPEEVEVRADTGEGTYETNDLLLLVNPRTGREVVRVGTANTDDYYPCCVLEFDPTALEANRRD